MPICIKENQKSAYLYLCGIKPAREVKLGEGISLIPASSNPNPDDMIDSIMKSDHASELELGVLIATLRMTTAQIKIEDATGKDLAVKTWNTQQICVQISTIHSLCVRILREEIRYFNYPHYPHFPQSPRKPLFSRLSENLPIPF